jgi:hypothetical protein
MGGQRMRLVTHLDVTAGDVEEALRAFEECLKQGIRDRPVFGTGPFSR